MVTALKTEMAPQTFSDALNNPIVVVGSGPVGVRTVQELLRLNPQQEIIIYGDEPYEPYNRVRLTQMLAGHSTWADIFSSLRLPDTPNLIKRYNCPITTINTKEMLVVDSLGQMQHYSSLVLATGSTPYVPSIPGNRLAGVFTLRNMSDAIGLAARRVRTRKTLVIGGGLLGIEAARALQRSHTEVSIIQHGSRLMPAQLDENGAELIHEQANAMGITVYLNDGVQEILGDRLVSGVRLRSGKELSFDTIVLATGITPNTKLAREIGLSVGRGIRVNDQLLTSDPHIYAVGECTEHRGKIYGLVAPGLEQASVAAHTILNRPASYLGSISAANLKVIGKSVFSIGTVTDDVVSNLDKVYEYRDKHSDTYRRVVLHRGRLIGAIAIGNWGQLSRIQEGVTYNRRVLPWKIARFKKSGDIWPDEQAENIHQWPVTATVCNCTGVTRGALSAAIEGGCNSVESLSQCTGASSVCGSCRPKLSQLLGEAPAPLISKGRSALTIISIISVILASMIVLLTPIAFNQTVQLDWHISELWLDNFYKEFSGFTLLGLSVVGLLISLRKRIKKISQHKSVGDFGYWRVMHVLLGSLALITLALHTGFRMGDNLNFLLMLSFVGLAVVGAVAGGFTAYEAKNPSLSLGRLRRCTNWAHIILFWPLPVLLGFHVLKSYVY